MKIFILLILPLLSLGSFQPVSAQENPLAGDIDPSAFTIGIKRDGSSMGYTNAVGYDASIDGNGVVTFEGISGMPLKGRFTFYLDTAEVGSLVEDFRKINFFSLEDKYTGKKLANGMTEIVSHAMKTTTTLTVNGKTKSVFNFYGAPEELDALQNKIDKLLQRFYAPDAPGVK